MKSWEHSVGGLLSVLRLDSIKGKILVLALLATLIPALSTAYLSYRQNSRSLAEALESELRSTGSQTQRELDLWVRERFSDVRVFVSSFEVSENLERIPQGGAIGDIALTRLADYLRGVETRFSDYTELLVADPSMQPVASSGESLSEVALPPDWLTELQRGETMFGEPYWDEEAGRVAATIAVPIESTVGEYLGVLTATLTFDAVREILDGFAPGEAGRISLITGDGRGIAASEAEATRLEPVVTEATLALLTAATVGTSEYVDLAGVEVVGTLTDVPRLGWAVIVEIPRAEAYSQIADLRNSALALLSVLLVVVGFIAYLLGLFIVRPLGRLAVGAGAVASGDLSVDLPVAGRGEVAYLTEAFNNMVGQLRQGREQLEEVHNTLRVQNRELELLSVTDALTGLHNRRHIMETLDKEIRRAERQERPLSVLMLDVDRFKEYNDTYGHLAGDQVLMAMGRVLTDATRDLDFNARYGGEEFIVLLPDCDLDGAVDAAERLRTRLAEDTFEGGAITVSIGAAQYPDHGETPTDMIASADVALYAAKHAGRDRVMRASPKSAPKSASGTKAAPEANRGGSKTAGTPTGGGPAKKTSGRKKTASAKKETPAKKGAKEPAGKKAAQKKKKPS